MYKKSFALLLIITYITNSPYGSGNTQQKIDDHIKNNLQYIDPTQRAKYLTLQQELDRNNRHITNSMSKPGMSTMVTVSSLISGLIGGYYFTGQAQIGVVITSMLGVFGGLVGTLFCDKNDPYLNANVDLIKEIKNIDPNSTNK